jgi:hypothetical protein
MVNEGQPKRSFVHQHDDVADMGEVPHSLRSVKLKLASFV